MRLRRSSGDSVTAAVLPPPRRRRRRRRRSRCQASARQRVRRPGCAAGVCVVQILCAIPGIPKTERIASQAPPRATLPLAEPSAAAAAAARLPPPPPCASGLLSVCVRSAALSRCPGPVCACTRRRRPVCTEWQAARALVHAHPPRAKLTYTCSVRVREPRAENSDELRSPLASSRCALNPGARATPCIRTPVSAKCTVRRAAAAAAAASVARAAHT